MEHSSHKPVIVDGVRTPFVRSQSSYMDLSSYDLGRLVIRALMDKTHISSEQIEHVILGTVLHDPRTPNVARESLLGADISPNIPCSTVSLACISSNIAATQLADMISLGRIKVGIVGGLDTCSDPPIRVSRGLRKTLLQLSKIKTPWAMSKYFSALGKLHLKDISLDIPSVTEFSNGKSMGQGAEILAQQVSVTRGDSDAYAARSHQFACKAQKEGVFDKYIVPVYTKPKFGAHLKDEGPREDTSIDRLAKLRPAFDRDFGVCTAGNSSFLTDGSSALLVMSEKTAKESDCEPMAVIKDYVYRAGDPLTEMLSGPALTIPSLLEQNSLKVSDVDVWEIHEAFASQVLANLVLLNSKAFCNKRLNMQAVGEIPIEKVNVWGGSLSLGHPFGATGARLLYTAARRLKHENAKFAVVSGCAAGGHGSAILLENPSR